VELGKIRGEVKLLRAIALVNAILVAQVIAKVVAIPHVVLVAPVNVIPDAVVGVETAVIHNVLDAKPHVPHKVFVVVVLCAQDVLRNAGPDAKLHVDEFVKLVRQPEAIVPTVVVKDIAMVVTQIAEVFVITVALQVVRMSVKDAIIHNSLIVEHHMLHRLQPVPSMVLFIAHLKVLFMVPLLPLIIKRNLMFQVPGKYQPTYS
jgi:hypothetical protein